MTKLNTRAALELLVEAVVSGTIPDIRDAIAAARAALAQPMPVGPSNEELDELFTEIDQGGEALSWRACWRAYARAVLARWGLND